VFANAYLLAKGEWYHGYERASTIANQLIMRCRRAFTQYYVRTFYTYACLRDISAEKGEGSVEWISHEEKIFLKLAEIRIFYDFD